MATPSKIFVPSGKLTPLTYNRANGDYINRISGPRGNFALIVDDVMVSVSAQWDELSEAEKVVIGLILNRETVEQGTTPVSTEPVKV